MSERDETRGKPTLLPPEKQYDVRLGVDDAAVVAKAAALAGELASAWIARVAVERALKLAKLSGAEK